MPHILAYTLVEVLVKMDDSEEIFRYAAGGFRDFTRIASSSPEMWRDICSMNKTAIIDMMDRYMEELSHLKIIIEEDSQNEILDSFNRSKNARDSLG